MQTVKTFLVARAIHKAYEEAGRDVKLFRTALEQGFIRQRIHYDREPPGMDYVCFSGLGIWIGPPSARGGEDDGRFLAFLRDAGLKAGLLVHCRPEGVVMQHLQLPKRVSIDSAADKREALP